MNLNSISIIGVVAALLASAVPVAAGEADVIKVVAHKSGDLFKFDVTIRSHDR